MLRGATSSERLHAFLVGGGWVKIVRGVRGAVVSISFGHLSVAMTTDWGLLGVNFGADNPCANFGHHVYLGLE